MIHGFSEFHHLFVGVLDFSPLVYLERPMQEVERRKIPVEIENLVSQFCAAYPLVLEHEALLREILSGFGKLRPGNLESDSGLQIDHLLRLFVTFGLSLDDLHYHSDRLIGIFQEHGYQVDRGDDFRKGLSEIADLFRLPVAELLANGVTELPRIPVPDPMYGDPTWNERVRNGRSRVASLTRWFATDAKTILGIVNIGASKEELLGRWPQMLDRLVDQKRDFGLFDPPVNELAGLADEQFLTDDLFYQTPPYLPLPGVGVRMQPRVVDHWPIDPPISWRVRE